MILQPAMQDGQGVTVAYQSSGFASLLQRQNEPTLQRMARYRITPKSPVPFDEVPATSGVYIVRAAGTDRYKIGYARRNLRQRIRNLRIGSPFVLEAVRIFERAPRDFEKDLHKRFARSRVHGEWFTESADLLDFIRGLW